MGIWQMCSSTRSWSVFARIIFFRNAMWVSEFNLLILSYITHTLSKMFSWSDFKIYNVIFVFVIRVFFQFVYWSFPPPIWDSILTCPIIQTVSHLNHLLKITPLPFCVLSTYHQLLQSKTHCILNIGVGGFAVSEGGERLGGMWVGQMLLKHMNRHLSTCVIVNSDHLSTQNSTSIPFRNADPSTSYTNFLTISTANVKWHTNMSYNSDCFLV